MSFALFSAAHNVNVVLFYRRQTRTVYLLDVTGSLLDIEPMTFLLLREIPIVAEGCDFNLSLRRRQNVAFAMLTALLNGLERSIAQVQHLASELAGEPNTLTVDLGDRTHLMGRMRIFRAATLLYFAGQLHPATILEEAHTTVETMLREVAGDGTFAQMAAVALADDLIDQELHDLMIRLKDLRVGVKHEGRGVKEAAVTDLVYAVVRFCHRVAASFAVAERI